jgi:hypothetical protein
MSVGGSQGCPRRDGQVLHRRYGVATGGPQILPWVLAEDLPPLVGALWTGRYVFLIEPVQGSGRPSSRGGRRVSAIPRCDDDPLVPTGGAENPENSRSVGLARRHASALAPGKYSPDQGQCNGAAEGDRTLVISLEN